MTLPIASEVAIALVPDAAILPEMSDGLRDSFLELRKEIEVKVQKVIDDTLDEAIKVEADRSEAGQNCHQCGSGLPRIVCLHCHAHHLMVSEHFMRYHRRLEKERRS